MIEFLFITGQKKIKKEKEKGKGGLPNHYLKVNFAENEIIDLHKSLGDWGEEEIGKMKQVKLRYFEPHSERQKHKNGKMCVENEHLPEEGVLFYVL